MDFDLPCYPFLLICETHYPVVTERSWLEFLKDNVLLIGLALTAGTLFFTGQTFLRAQAWKRKEFVVAEFERLRSDERAHAAMLMLDHGETYLRIPLPLKLAEDQHLSGAEMPRSVKGRYLAKDSGYFIRVGTTKQLMALMHHDLENRPAFDVTIMYLKECFDALFSRLGALQAMVNSGLVKRKDLDPYMGYWLTLLTGQRKAEGKVHAPPGHRVPVFAAIKVYLRAYGYNDLIELVGKDYGSLEPTEKDHAIVRDIAKAIRAEQLANSGAASAPLEPQTDDAADTTG